MDSAQHQLADSLKSANNILVTVSRDPSVDQLAALLGLTLLLNKMGKHAAAVFSGAVPSTLEFLKPEDTIEKNTDSLRDFIIALDKSKADKLRYKVEDDVVRIFITPYKTSITQDDLEFSQGDFNVDVVVALGVHQQEDLDEAITTHGRILHDATVACINSGAGESLGSVNWTDPAASSLCELVTELGQSLGDNLLDNQISTALLTGIVAETQRFSNEKTSSTTMSVSAALMAAGANQQLVASKLEEDGSADDGGAVTPPSSGDDSPSSGDGTLAIDHENDEEEKPAEAPADEGPTLPEPSFDLPSEAAPSEPAEQPADSGPAITGGSRLITEPPTLGGTLTANTSQHEYEPTSDPLSVPTSGPARILSRDSATPEPSKPEEPSSPTLTPPPTDWTPPAAPTPPPPPATPPPGPAPNTLADLEKAVDSPHNASPEDLNAARDEVTKALNSSDAPQQPPAPIQALNAQPLGKIQHDDTNPMAGIPPVPPGLIPEEENKPADDHPATPQVIDPTAPPPVPPPIPFQFGQPGQGPANPEQKQ